jgi:hypothetical protein
VGGSEGGQSGSSKSRIITVSGEDFDSFYSEQRESFDVAFSMSSLDHDGACHVATAVMVSCCYVMRCAVVLCSCYVVSCHVVTRQCSRFICKFINVVIISLPAVALALVTHLHTYKRIHVHT